MNLLIKAVRKSKNFTSEKVCMKKASIRFGHSRTHSHSHSHAVFCGLAKNLHPGAQACRQAGRELESGATKNVGREIKNSVFKYFTLTPTLTLYFVASPRIELGSGASETLILSIVLRGRGCKSNISALIPCFFRCDRRFSS